MGVGILRINWVFNAIKYYLTKFSKPITSKCQTFWKPRSNLIQFSPSDRVGPLTKISLTPISWARQAIFEYRSRHLEQNKKWTLFNYYNIHRSIEPAGQWTRKELTKFYEKPPILIKNTRHPPNMPEPPESGPRILISNSRRTGGWGVSRNYSYFKISLHGICHERGSYFKNITLHRNFLILKTWGGCERSSEIHPPDSPRGPSVASYDILILKIARSVPILLLRCWCVQAFMRPLVRGPGSSKTQRGISLNLYIVMDRIEVVQSRDKSNNKAWK